MKTLGELAALVGGRLDGDAAREVRAVAAPADAGPEDVTFLAAARHAEAAAGTRAACLVVGEDAEAGSGGGLALLRVADPDRAVSRIAEALLPPLPVPEPGVHPDASVDASAELGEAVHVGAGAVVLAGARIGRRSRVRAGAVVAQDVVLGADCDIHAGAVLRERVRLGDRVIVHAGAVLGADGFGYTAGEAGPEKVPQLGTVEVGDEAEIGAGTTVDRARFGVTRIGPRVKIDNLVQIAHNVEIGEGTLIVSQVAIAGSTRIGRACVIAGQAAIDGHLTIGDGARIAAKAGVTKDVPPHTDVSGYPAEPHRVHLRREAALRQVDRLKARIEALERALAARGPEAPP